MSRLIALVAVVLSWAAVVPLASAQSAPGCILTDRQLDCLQGDSLNRRGRDARYHAGLAADETATLFTDPIASLATFPSEWDRELFRRSLERARYSAMRHMRRQFALHKAGRLNEDEIQSAMADHEKMLAHYKQGYWFYKELGWNRR